MQHPPQPRRRRLAARIVGRPGRYALACGLTAAAVATPIALGASGTVSSRDALQGGRRNPTSLSTQRPAYRTETKVVADNSTYATRQSNLSSNGGGAIYGCRSRAAGVRAGEEPCVRADNLSTGEAFEFQFTSGALGGLIQAGTTITTTHPTARPFVTNATAVATGLNADRVDDMNAADIVAKAASARAFARVIGRPTGTDTIDDAHSQNVADANVTHAGTGVYCVAGLSPAPKSAVANLQSPPAGPTGASQVYVDSTGGAAACPGSEQIAVRTVNAAGAPANGDFSMQIAG